MAGDPFGPEMADQDEAFEVDLPEEEEQDFTIPAGMYTAGVADVVKSTSNAGNPMWIWHFQIMEGEHEGHVLRLYTALTPAAMWKLREVIEATGLGQGGQTSKFSRQDAIGKKCMLSVVDDEYQGTKRSSIDGCYPLNS